MAAPARVQVPEQLTAASTGADPVDASLRTIRVAVHLALLLPVVAVVCNLLVWRTSLAWFVWAGLSIVAVATSFAAWVAGRLVTRFGPAIQALSTAQTRFLDELPSRWIPAAIAGSAGVSLLLELAMIRWQGTEWETFAFYKNFGLLACFLGLGLGYALAGRSRIPGVLVLPVLAFQAVYLIALRHAIPSQYLLSLRVTPISEQLHMGLRSASPVDYGGIFLFLTVVVVLTALAFVPVGQICGRLLRRMPQLRAYGWNLAGSLAGVAAMFAVSLLWTPPIIWFVPCLLALCLTQLYERRALVTAIVSAMVMIVALAWPVEFGWERTYSPYQLLERGRGEHGLMLLRAAGQYYQRVHDLSPAGRIAHPGGDFLARHYEFPYDLRPAPGRVAIVGAGTGNDVAAALRRGAGRVDAIEIDPAIMRFGAQYHPEMPYQDPRVRSVVADARSFLLDSTDQYDLIVYGLLDSHTLLSHTSSVRLDSYVYTVEGLREARARLAPDGVVSLSFAVMSDEIGRKLYLMMQEAFDGRPPVVVLAGYDESVLFLQSKSGHLEVDPTVLARAGVTDLGAVYANPAIRADISTDDWPFFYMPQRVYPVSYVVVVLLLLTIAGLLYASYIGERPTTGGLPFFFLGAGFMLVETKGIAELGLTFGNTWQVIAVVIAAILAMAWVGNWLVDRLRIQRPWVPYTLLGVSLIMGLLFARAGGLPATTAGRAATVIILTCPLLFSGIVFSTTLARTRDTASALGMNLLGAMAGGMLEYNSMYFGFQSLYWLGLVVYGMAFVSSLRRLAPELSPALSP
jgi:spermidine synthase